MSRNRFKNLNLTFKIKTNFEENDYKLIDSINSEYSKFKIEQLANIIRGKKYKKNPYLLEY